MWRNLRYYGVQCTNLVMDTALGTVCTKERTDAVEHYIFVSRWSIYTALTMCKISDKAGAMMSAPEIAGCDQDWPRNAWWPAWFVLEYFDTCIHQGSFDS